VIAWFTSPVTDWLQVTVTVEVAVSPTPVGL
jgi:hypothetical protein